MAGIRTHSFLLEFMSKSSLGTHYTVDSGRCGQAVPSPSRFEFPSRWQFLPSIFAAKAAEAILLGWPAKMREEGLIGLRVEASWRFLVCLYFRRDTATRPGVLWAASSAGFWCFLLVERWESRWKISSEGIRLHWPLRLRRGGLPSACLNAAGICPPRSLRAVGAS
jgi:hypothetical protein